MVFIPIEDLDLLLNLEDEAELYAKISGKFKKLNSLFWDKANLRLLDHLRLKPRSRVLDLACGSGGFAIKMAKKFPHISVVGVDIHPEMLNQARTDAQTADVANIEFMEQDLQHLLPAFRDEHFDVGICQFALSYLGVETVLKEMRRLLNSSGQVGVTTSSFNSLTEWQPTFLQFFAENQGSFDLSQFPTAPQQPMDAEDLKKRMEAVGFENVRVEPIKVPLRFATIDQAACFFISSTWLSNQVYAMQNKDLRRFVVQWAMERISGLYPPGSEITTSIEFLVGWNEP